MEEDRCLNAAMVLERLSDNHLVLKGFLDSGYIGLSDGENLATIHKDQIPSELRKRIRKVEATKFFNPMMGSFEYNEEIISCTASRLTWACADERDLPRNEYPL